MARRWRRTEALILCKYPWMELLTFGPFRLDRASYTLSTSAAGESDQPIALRRKAFDVLRYLVEHAGRVVSHDEFLSELWPETYVQPEVLKGHVLAVRTALDDRTAPPRYIETVRGRGYRFIAKVSATPRNSAPSHAKVAELLVGRAAALTDLQAGLSWARAGEAQIFFVMGEAGIGKTALVEAFATAAAAVATVVTGHSLPGSGQSDAYYPILELLGSLSRGAFQDSLVPLLSRLAPTWLVQLPALRPASLTDLSRDVIGATPHRMARELCDLLDVLSDSTPLLIILEDLHWADSATLDLIHALASRKMRAKLMIVATLRTSLSAESDRAAGTLAHKLALYRLAREVRLRTLAAEDVATFLNGFAGAPPPQELTTHLYVRSEGNPLFMQAMLDSLLKRNLVAFDPSGWRLDAGLESLGRRAPPSLAQIIEGEIHSLSLETQSVLEAASISDGPFSASTHSAASGVDEQRFEDICESLARRGQLIRRSGIVETPDGRVAQTYTFRHALFQEVAQDRQGVVRRTRSHGAVAARLASVFAADLAQIAAQLAHHYAEAGQWPQAIRYLRMTARTAMRRFAHREAASLLEQAVAVSRNLPIDERMEAQLVALEELAGIYMGTQDPRAEATYERLCQLAGELGRVDVEGRALFGLGYVVSWSDGDRCLEIMSRVLEKCADITDRVKSARLRSNAHGWRSWIQGWSAEDARGLRAAMEELRELNDPLAFAASLFAYSTILFPAARYREGIEVVTRGFDVLVTHALEAQVDLGLPLWIMRLGIPWSLMSLGRFGEALASFASGYEAYEANGDVGPGATLRLYKAFVYQRMHAHEEALQWLDDTAARMRDSGAELSPNETKVEFVIRGLAELGLGRVQEAFVHLRAARAQMNARTTLSGWYWRLAVEWGMSDAYLAAGDGSAAESCAQAFLERASATEERSWRALAEESCARVALARRNTTAARAHLARAWAHIEGYDAALVRWRLHAVQARMSDICGEPDLAASQRRSQADELASLAASLPANHPGRDALRAATLLAPHLDAWPDAADVSRSRN